MATAPLATFEAYRAWDLNPDPTMQSQAIDALESGKVLFFPHLPFTLSPEETDIFSLGEQGAGGTQQAKNISFHPQTGQLKGCDPQTPLNPILKTVMARFAEQTQNLLEKVLPHYASSLRQAKTSFRPVEAKGRPLSPRKDDTKLHVDAFPSNPMQGERILRVFSNVNPQSVPRVWRLGSPFEMTASQFLPKLNTRVWPGSASVLNLLGITKRRRTRYDHVMLQLHDLMKFDAAFQENIPQETVHFPTGSTWVVYTDQASHAAMSGQHLLEQTFHLPVAGMKDRTRSPLHILEKLTKKQLVRSQRAH